MLPKTNRFLGKSLFIALSIFIAVTVFYTDAQADLSDFVFVTENEHLELYIKNSTTEIAVVEKRTGNTWYSNPNDRGTMEKIARGSARDRLNSQLSIGYYVGNQYITMDNYTESIVHDQHEIIPIENGVRVEYLIGRTWNDNDYVPLVISQEEFDVLLSYLDEKDHKFVRSLYASFQLEHGYEDPDNISVLGVDFEQLFGEYGLKVDEPGFRANDKRRLIQEYLKAVQNYKGYASLGGVKTEDIEALFDTPTLMLKWNIMIWDREDLINLIKESGYSPEFIIEEHQKYNVEPPSKNLRVFNVAIEYILDGTDLVVRVPHDSIIYPKDVIDPSNNKPYTFPLVQINVLPYFGAANSEETGYMLVPDGSGALINLNSGKTSAQPYRQRVYGRDHSTSAVREFSFDMETQIHLPVFGSKHEDKGFLAVIESGDTFAQIQAEIAGMSDSYNKVWTSFFYIPNARVYMQSGGAVIYMRDLSINMYQVRPYQEDMVIRYTFLDKDEASYVGMAHRYQQYLVDRYQLDRMVPTDKIPLLLELVGGIEKVEPVFGVSQKVVKPITTFEQAGLIVDDLIAQGIDELVVRYSGWLKGGLEHVFPAKLKLETKLGSEAELKQLAADLAAKNIDLYPNVNFLNVYKSSLLGFINFRDAARGLDRRPAYLNRYDLATHLRVTGEEIPLLSPAKFPSVIDGFMKGYKDLGISGLSFDVLGEQLYADYRVKEQELVDRDQARDIFVNELTKIKEQGYKLMFSGTNAYTLPFADFVVDAPSYTRNFEIIDGGVPFYQIVLRGYIPYAGEPGNLTRRSQTYLLKLLETGAVPYYMVSYADSVEVKASRFESLYSLNYQDRSDDIVDMYTEANSILQPLWHERIIDHEALAVNVYRTTYENGTSVIVNYNSVPVEVLGIEIPGYGYKILSGGEQSGQN